MDLTILYPPSHRPAGTRDLQGIIEEAGGGIRDIVPEGRGL